MTVCERYWSPDLCASCVGIEEADELTNGKTECKASGVCKHLKGEDAKASGLACNPPLLLFCSGLSDELPLLERVIHFDVDENGLPTFRALSYLDFETVLNPSDFITMAGAWLNSKRNEAAERRLKNGRR